jgi:hypothetical protein
VRLYECTFQRYKLFCNNSLFGSRNSYELRKICEMLLHLHLSDCLQLNKKKKKQENIFLVPIVGKREEKKKLMLVVLHLEHRGCMFSNINCEQCMLLLLEETKLLIYTKAMYTFCVVFFFLPNIILGLVPHKSASQLCINKYYISQCTCSLCTFLFLILFHFILLFFCCIYI